MARSDRREAPRIPPTYKRLGGRAGPVMRLDAGVSTSRNTSLNLGARRPVPLVGFSPAWSALAGEIAACTRCPLHRTRRHVVVYRGGPRPWALFVGEAPGADEDLAGIPFVGRAGKRLDAAIGFLGLGPEAFGVLNVVKCRPPKNRFSPEAASACRPFLDRQLALLRPGVVVTLGAHALAAFEPNVRRITEVAGIPRQWGATPLFPLLHPAAAMHAPKYRDRWDHDVRGLDRFLRSLPGRP